MYRITQLSSIALLVASVVVSMARASDYYSKVPPLPTVLVGSDGEGATPANRVRGKEYSHNDWLAVRGDPNIVSFGDHDASGGIDPLQVVSWDGIPGRIGGNSGSVNAFDYASGSFNCPDCQVDAIANSGDFLFRQVVSNQATLLFSTTGDIDASSVLTGPAPVIVPKAHVHWEAPVGPGAGLGVGQGIWAGFESPPAAVGPGVNHHPVSDLDALEVWGPEPPSHDILAGPSPVSEGYIGGIGGPNTADSNRFSLDGDLFAGTSVWAYDIATGFSAPWVLQSEIVIAIEKLFLPAGFRFDDATARLIDIDALMTRDVGQASPTAPLWNPGDELLFSIDPISGGMILDPSGAPSPAPFIDGGEVMHLVKTAAGVGPGTISISFLKHGGHTWDTAFPVATTFGYYFEDVDALEAVGTLTGDREIPTPEPASAVLVFLGIAGIGLLRSARE